MPHIRHDIEQQSYKTRMLIRIIQANTKCSFRPKKGSKTKHIFKMRFVAK